MAALLLLALLMSAPCARAAPGTTGANFLKIGVGARPVALGEAYTALADDTHAIYYNPAGLAFIERQEISMMHNQYFQGVSQQWLAYAYPSPYYGTVGGAFTVLRVKPFEAYDTLDQRAGNVSASDMAGAAAYAFELPGFHDLAVGASLKVVSSRLASYSATTGALDVGLLRSWGELGSWSFGAAVRNLGPGVKFVSEEFPMPASLHAGLAYRGSMAPMWADATFTFIAEAAADRDRSPYAAGGFEFRPVEELPIRLGYRQNEDAGIGLSAGLGFRSLEGGFVADWFPDLALDYAFVDHGPLEAVHRVSVTFRFGTRKGERREGSQRQAPRFHYLLKD